MTDTTSKNIPYICGVTLDSTGVAGSRVSLVNYTTGERIVRSTNSSKKVIFDLSELPTAYAVGDKLHFINIGSSFGVATHTISSLVAGFTAISITCTAAGTGGLTI